MQAAQRIWPIVQGRGEEGRRARRRAACSSTPSTPTRCSEVLGGALAPDANCTLRITYGTVKSLKPDSQARRTGRSRPRRRSSRRTPARSRSTRRRSCSTRSRRRSSARTPTRRSAASCRSTSCRDLDITGGNSGSPTLNDKGELVGLAFDGNKEGVASDVVFNGEHDAHDPRRRALHAVDDGPARRRRPPPQGDGCSSRSCSSRCTRRAVRSRASPT